MSQRTYEANKAIAARWEQEQQFVREGKGTRNWTIEQQKNILEKGKAYDDLGRAFQGQHMKSVNRFPEYQGEPDNIQFLTLDEHFAAHGGSWLNPTNWYYDPITKERTCFGSGKYLPCKVIDLSNPIIKNNILDTCPSQMTIDAPNRSRTEGKLHSWVSDDFQKSLEKNTDHEVEVEPPVKNESGLRRWIKNKQRQFRDWIEYDFIPNLPRHLDSLGNKFVKGIGLYMDIKTDFSSESDFSLNSSRNNVEKDTGSLSDDKTHQVETNFSENTTIEQSPVNTSEESINQDVSRISHEGTPKSPHLRHGHQSHVWTGPKDGKRVRKEIWIDDIHVHDAQQDEYSDNEEDD